MAWMSDEAWLNVIALSDVSGNKNASTSFFQQLPDKIIANEAVWKRWYEDNEPESMAIPDYDARISDTPDIGGFLKLLLVDGFFSQKPPGRVLKDVG